MSRIKEIHVLGRFLDHLGNGTHTEMIFERYKLLEMVDDDIRTDSEPFWAQTKNFKVR